MLEQRRCLWPHEVNKTHRLPFAPIIEFHVLNQRLHIKTCFGLAGVPLVNSSESDERFSFLALIKSKSRRLGNKDKQKYSANNIWKSADDHEQAPRFKCQIQPLNVKAPLLIDDQNSEQRIQQADYGVKNRSWNKNNFKRVEGKIYGSRLTVYQQRYIINTAVSFFVWKNLFGDVTALLVDHWHLIIKGYKLNFFTKH